MLQAVPLAGSERTNALIHLYRAEVARMTSYRLRLDTTTNWAVGTTAAIVSFALGNARIPHYALLLSVLLNLLFLWMESRRFQSYRLIQNRVRILEQGFMMEAVQPEGALTDWETKLGASLSKPVLPVSLRQAFAVRTRRNYFWLFLVTYGGWLLKLELSGGLPEAANTSLVAGGWVVVVALLPLLVLVVVAARLPTDDPD